MSGSIDSSETWEWNGANWTLVPTPIAPVGRRGHVMAYDAARRRTVLFGGRIGSKDTSETWEYDGVTWLQIHPPLQPTGRSFTTMAYDPQRQRIILGGGYNDLGSVVGDFWEWDGATWALLKTTTRPPVRYGFGLAFDAVKPPNSIRRRRSYVDDTLGDTWELTYGAPSETPERCVSATEDADRDGAIGCADPDCWGRCDPLCIPGTPACDASRPRCGDGACQALEDNAMCPTDCP